MEKTVIEVDENSQTLHFINRILEGGFPFGAWNYVSTEFFFLKRIKPQTISKVLQLTTYL
jgi:hypothetical protein